MLQREGDPPPGTAVHIPMGGFKDTDNGGVKHFAWWTEIVPGGAAGLPRGFVRRGWHGVKQKLGSFLEVQRDGLRDLRGAVAWTVGRVGGLLRTSRGADRDDGGEEGGGGGPQPGASEVRLEGRRPKELWGEVAFPTLSPAAVVDELGVVDELVERESVAQQRAESGRLRSWFSTCEGGDEDVLFPGAPAPSGEEGFCTADNIPDPASTDHGSVEAGSGRSATSRTIALLAARRQEEAVIRARVGGLETVARRIVPRGGHGGRSPDRGQEGPSGGGTEFRALTPEEERSFARGSDVYWSGRSRDTLDQSGDEDVAAAADSMEVPEKHEGRSVPPGSGWSSAASDARRASDAAEDHPEKQPTPAEAPPRRKNSAPGSTKKKTPAKEPKRGKKSSVKTKLAGVERPPGDHAGVESPCNQDGFIDLKAFCPLPGTAPLDGKASKAVIAKFVSVNEGILKQCAWNIAQLLLAPVRKASILRTEVLRTGIQDPQDEEYKMVRDKYARAKKARRAARMAGRKKRRLEAERAGSETATRAGAGAGPHAEKKRLETEAEPNKVAASQRLGEGDIRNHQEAATAHSTYGNKERRPIAEDPSNIPKSVYLTKDTYQRLARRDATANVLQELISVHIYYNKGGKFATTQKLGKAAFGKGGKMLPGLMDGLYLARLRKFSEYLLRQSRFGDLNFQNKIVRNSLNGGFAADATLAYAQLKKGSLKSYLEGQRVANYNLGTTSSTEARGASEIERSPRDDRVSTSEDHDDEPPRPVRFWTYRPPSSKEGNLLTAVGFPGSPALEAREVVQTTLADGDAGDDNKVSKTQQELLDATGFRNWIDADQEMVYMHFDQPQVGELLHLVQQQKAFLAHQSSQGGAAPNDHSTYLTLEEAWKLRNNEFPVQPAWTLLADWLDQDGVFRGYLNPKQQLSLAMRVSASLQKFVDFLAADRFALVRELHAMFKGAALGRTRWVVWGCGRMFGGGIFMVVDSHTRLEVGVV